MLDVHKLLLQQGSHTLRHRANVDVLSRAINLEEAVQYEARGQRKYTAEWDLMQERTHAYTGHKAIYGNYRSCSVEQIKHVCILCGMTQTEQYVQYLLLQQNLM